MSNHVAVLVPWDDPPCEWRRRAWAWVRSRWAAEWPGWEIIEGTSPPGPYSRTGGILDAASRTDADLLIVTDADVWVDPTDAVLAAQSHGWAIPHRLIHRLSAESTSAVLDTAADWRSLPLSRDNHQDSRPYVGHETGTWVVLRRDVFRAAPPDPRFVGWGQEDDAWALALRCLVGRPWRGNLDLVHLWHPPQARVSRVLGNPANAALLRRYRAASRDADLMRDLIEEGRSCLSRR
jgi:hypothetical protein